MLEKHYCCGVWVSQEECCGKCNNMKMLEKEIERKVCDYAKSKNMLAYKFTSPARAAVPDRLFIAPNGTVFFAEFKRAGAKPTPAQEREHTRLRQQKVNVFVIDNVAAGIEMIDSMVGGT